MLLFCVCVNRQPQYVYVGEVTRRALDLYCVIGLEQYVAVLDRTFHDFKRRES